MNNPRPQTTRNDASKEPLSRYESLLLSLHELIRQEKGSSTAASDIRDELEQLREQLTEIQIDRVDGLTGDLYSLNGSESFDDYSDEERMVALTRAGKAFESSEWDGVLDALRVAAPKLAHDQLAMTRGRCWHRLERYTIAVTFYDLASKCRDRVR